jgi:hypothetical protein
VANDIDMWNDIEQLEKLGKFKEASWLHAVYCAWFINYDKAEANRLSKLAKKEFPDFPFDFRGYGVDVE